MAGCGRAPTATQRSASTLLPAPPWFPAARRRTWPVARSQPGYCAIGDSHGWTPAAISAACCAAAAKWGRAASRRTASATMSLGRVSGSAPPPQPQRTPSATRRRPNVDIRYRIDGCAIDGTRCRLTPTFSCRGISPLVRHRAQSELWATTDSRSSPAHWGQARGFIRSGWDAWSSALPHSSGMLT